MIQEAATLSLAIPVEIVFSRQIVIHIGVSDFSGFFHHSDLSLSFGPLLCGTNYFTIKTTTNESFEYNCGNYARIFEWWRLVVVNGLEIPPSLKIGQLIDESDRRRRRHRVDLCIYNELLLISSFQIYF